MDKPRLAVIIPTFNRARTIKRAVDSVLSDRRSNIEVAVVDDFSNDRTLEILSEITDPRLTVTRMASQGHANRARNRGAALTTAPILAFLDSDDEFMPGRVERLVQFFAANPATDAAVDGFHVFGAGSRQMVSLPPQQMAKAVLEGLLVSHALPLTSSVISMRRSAFDQIGGFDPDLRRHQDRDLLLRLTRKHSVTIGSGIDVIKHQSPDSFSRDAGGYISGLDDLVARHRAFLAPASRDLLGYLVARMIVREVAAGRLRSAMRVLSALRASRHLPFGALSALLRYRAGRGIRREAEKLLASDRHANASHGS